MVLLSNIPNALINNIGFMALLYMMYELFLTQNGIHHTHIQKLHFI